MCWTGLCSRPYSYTTGVPSRQGGRPLMSRCYEFLLGRRITNLLFYFFWTTYPKIKDSQHFIQTCWKPIRNGQNTVMDTLSAITVDRKMLMNTIICTSSSSFKKFTDAPISFSWTLDKKSSVFTLCLGIYRRLATVMA